MQTESLSQQATQTHMVSPSSTHSLGAPFQASTVEAMDVSARMEGEVPAWLRGQLVRTAPTVFDHHGYRAAHWFDGLGMLYAFAVRDGGVRFKQQLLQSAARTAIEKGDRSTASFGTPIVRSFFKRLAQPSPAITDNANVNVVALGDQLVALTESPHQVVFDPASLKATGRVKYEDNEGSLVMLAHPHFDFERKVVVNAAMALGGASPHVALYDHAPTSRNRRVFARIRASRLPYLHSFGLTPKHAIVLWHPFTVNPISMLWSNRGFIDHFQFAASEPTKLIVVDRNDGSTRTYEAPASFIFHEVNSYERADATVVEVIAYEDTSIIEALRTASLEAKVPVLTATHLRYVLPHGGTKAIVELASDARFEFPNISYARASGKEHSAVWGAAIEPKDGVLSARIVRVSSSGATFFGEGDYVVGEPVFVGRPGATDEEDGVILTVGTSASTKTTRLFILDPKTLSVLATATVDLAVALGFHGQFFRDR